MNHKMGLFIIHENICVYDLLYEPKRMKVWFSFYVWVYVSVDHKFETVMEHK